MMRQIRWSILNIGILALFALGAPTSHAVTSTIPAGLGTLTYTSSQASYECLVRAPSSFGRYSETSFSDFSYKSPAGNVTYIGSGAELITGSPAVGSCPKNGGTPATFTTTYATITFSPVSQTASVQYVSGHVNPKYLILGVTYAPPGSQSYVDYTASTQLGNTNSFSQSFSNQVSQSISVGGSTGIFGFSGGVMVTGTESNSYTQASNSSSSISVTKETSISVKTPGPSSDFVGADHDYDVIWLWLNPLALYSIPDDNYLQWNGYGYDMTDQPAMDIYPIEVGYLNGHFGPIPSTIAQVIARSWATYQVWPAGQGPGLTSSDLTTILQADPWGGILLTPFR